MLPCADATCCRVFRDPFAHVLIQVYHTQSLPNFCWLCSCLPMRRRYMLSGFRDLFAHALIQACHWIKHWKWHLWRMLKLTTRRRYTCRWVSATLLCRRTRSGEVLEGRQRYWRHEWWYLSAHVLGQRPQRESQHVSSPSSYRVVTYLLVFDSTVPFGPLFSTAPNMTCLKWINSQANCSHRSVLPYS